MELVIGGAFQGKLDFAKNHYNLADTDIYTCTNDEIDFSKRCIYSLEEFVYASIQSNREPLDYLKQNERHWDNSVFICQDIFCGVVPLGADMRAWRQNTGLICQYLSGKANHVYRVFCGLEQQLK